MSNGTDRTLSKSNYEIGIYTLADIGPDPLTWKIMSAQQRLKEIIPVVERAKRRDIGNQ